MTSKPAANLQPVSLIVGSPVIGTPALSGKVIQFGARAHEIINITELEPKPASWGPSNWTGTCARSSSTAAASHGSTTFESVYR